MKSSITYQGGRVNGARALTQIHRLAGGLARFLAIAVLFAVPFVAARAADGVVSELSALKHTIRTDKSGKTIEEYVPFTKIVPGDMLLCTVAYTNKSGAPAANVIVTLPIPPEMTLVPNSASNPAVDTAYSIDGGQTFDALEKLVVKDESGKTRPARTDDVNSVRWVLRTDLAPGQQGKVSYLATIK